MSASQSPPATGPAAATPSSFVERVRSRIGVPYRAAGDWTLADPSPAALRPAELVAWAAARAGRAVRLATDVIDLYFECVDAGTVLEAEAAIAVEGALVFRFAITTGAGAPPRDAAARRSVVTSEVAVTTGDGDVVRVDLAHGVLLAPAAGFGATHGALVPGLAYPPEVGALADRPVPLPGGVAGFRPWSELPILRRGARGGAVSVAQAMLIATGSSEQARAGITAAFGAATTRAVTEFQRRIASAHDESLPIDGVIGPATWGWLFVSTGREPPNGQILDS